MPGQPRSEPAPAPVTDRGAAPAAAAQFRAIMECRRTVRDFSPAPVPPEVLRDAIGAAASAPSGANLQPWRFVLVRDAAARRRLREGAEAEERRFYDGRASDEWLAALAPLGTDWRKPFLETAPVVIVVFELHKGPTSPRPYYAKESVGIATGFLLAALHHAGLAGARGPSPGDPPEAPVGGARHGLIRIVARPALTDRRARHTFRPVHQLGGRSQLSMWGKPVRIRR